MAEPIMSFPISSSHGENVTISVAYFYRFIAQWYHLAAILLNILAWNIIRRRHAVYFDNIIEHQHLALQLTRPGEWCYATRSRILSEHYVRRYHTHRDPRDLDCAIIFYKQFAEATIVSLPFSIWSHKTHAEVLSDGYYKLSTLYMMRFRLVRTLGDLDEASICLRRSIELLQSVNKPVPYHAQMELADCLGNRSFFRSNPADATEALVASRKAVEIGHQMESPAHEAFALVRYAECLGYNLKHEELEGVKEIADVYQKALDLLPKDNREKPYLIAHLAAALTRQAVLEFWREELHEHDYPLTMDRALRCYEEALATIDELSPMLCDNIVTDARTFVLIGLARHYDSRQRVCLDNSIFDARKALSYLDQIESEPAAADTKVEVDSIRISALKQISRYSRSPAEQDSVVMLHRNIVSNRDTSLNVRLAAARFWAAFARSSRHSSVAEAADWVLELQRYRAGLGINTEEQVRYLGSTYRSEAVNAIIPFGSDSNTTSEHDINRQVSFIESTLSLFWSTRMKTTGTFDVVAQHDPALKCELEETVAFLNDHREIVSLKDFATRNAETEARVSAIRNARDKFETLLQRARRIEGLQHFMKSRPFPELVQAADEGHIVILDAMGGSACNAFALSPGWSSATRLRLGLNKQSLGYSVVKNLCEEWARLTDTMPKLSRNNRKSMRVRLDGAGEEQAYKSFLRKLWLEIVNPILEQLGLKKVHNGPLPRIWWLPTGILTSLPVHAAGMYDFEEDCTPKFVVSSYLYSITNLIESREGLLSSPPLSQRLLAVGVSSAPDASPLPNAIPEVESIAALAQDSSRVLVLKNDRATKSTITAQLPSARWCHFACHAMQNPRSAVASHLVLCDDKLTLEDVMNLNHKNAEFLMLSACETCTGDATLTEDALHLTAGFMFAGFKSVIATQYSMHDADGPSVSRSIYQRLLQGETWNVKESARALHDAVEELRKHTPFRRWIPFVHFGV